MPAPQPDPAPRSYPPFVSLLRRGTGGPETAGNTNRLQDVEAWLLGKATGETDFLALFESFVWRLVAAGLPLDRASLHVGTLHPQLFGFAWNWARSDGICDEVKVSEASLQTEAYRRNPLYRVIEHGELLRGKTTDDEIVARFPIVAELAEQGFTEYIALPLSAGGAYHNAATAATRQPGGFSDSQYSGLRQVFSLLALHVERHIGLRIAENVLDTYLGRAAGSRVLRGSIKRGAGEPIHAVIWVSDLRGFTDLADRLSGARMIALLNAYFERLAGAVLAQDGEILKFIGDGLLAAFPYDSFQNRAGAAQAALAAAETALQELAALTAEPPPDLAEITGWQPLRTGIALHDGEVFFGNVGAPERLDFTVIGKAVNAAARIEALSKHLGRSILISGQVAALLDIPLENLGEHQLRGLAEPISLFSPVGA